MQGIDEFDGKWTRINAYNNIILSNAYIGLAFSGVQGANLMNNTVLSIGSAVCTLQPGAVAGSAAQTASPNSDASKVWGDMWIGAGGAKDGTPSTNVVIRNNIASTYALATGIIFDHNIIAGSAMRYHPAIPSGAQVTLPTIVDPDKLFSSFFPGEFKFDVHLKAGSPAIAAGVASGAPATDFYGTGRKLPIDDGAVAANPVQ